VPAAPHAFRESKRHKDRSGRTQQRASRLPRQYRGTFGTGCYGGSFLFWGAAPTAKGLSNIAAGVIGIPVAFVVTVVVSLLTPAPPHRGRCRSSSTPSASRGARW
jgi:hypothetical protein